MLDESEPSGGEPAGGGSGGGPHLRQALAATVLALVALVVGYRLGGINAQGDRNRWLTSGCAAVFLVTGVLAVRNAAEGAGRRTVPRAGTAAAAALRLACLVVGYALVFLAALDLAGVQLDHLFAGGALVAAVIGIAAQQVLGNLFAGLVLLFSRPYKPGERIRVRAGAINGPHDGTVVSMDLLYTTLLTAEGPMNIPNAVLLASAVGPAPEEPTGTEEPTATDTVIDTPADTLTSTTTGTPTSSTTRAAGPA